ncbi:50S ribosomal protein L23 [candidate division CSSED10-310 bacterium]|uniref:Large ribosomal subunit protein uL23 n=1 Tax=candidate division CSSED10-310 bacterium TaxID=2855610 RepID=A0ABV6YWX7_UNCC1
MEDPYKILIQPLITEKSTRLKDDSNKLMFKVHRDANKIEIKKAIESLFKVTVLRVNTLNMKGKVKRLGYNKGKRPDWKKAVVTLAAEDHIDFFEAV